VISRRDFNGRVLKLGAAAILGGNRNLAGAGTPSGFEPLPPDLPLPALSTATAPWIREARILQPWGKTQYLAFANVGDRPEGLSERFGFNVLMAMPVPAHNAITPAEYHLTERQFEEAISAFRRAGFKLMLYSSIMHCGHAPEWQFGSIESEHPDWSQLDAKGNAVTDYGHAWICPNSPGLEYTLHYTEELVRTYHPDAIMLDDNGFYHTNEGGWSCYCRYCQQGFRDYVQRRCGAQWLGRQLRLKPDQIEIPAEKGPLYSIWLHYRNRVWAHADEVFRKSLRQMDSSIVFFANNLFDYNQPEQSSDLQYDHEDAVFSESHYSDSWYMSEKMLYGQAIAAGKRPLWNYVATFDDAEYSRLRPPDVALPMVAASLAHRGLPWIVYYGFHQAANESTLQGMATLLSWYASHPEFFEGECWAPVAALVSPSSRNALGQPLFPANASFLLQRSVPLSMLRDEHVSSETLASVRIVTAENCGVMAAEAARALAAWVKAGGLLIAQSDVAAYDGTGRRTPGSVLWESLGFQQAPEGVAKAGRGQVIVVKPDQIGPVALAHAGALTFELPLAKVEVVAYRQPRRILLHVLRHRVFQRPVEIGTPTSLDITASVARWHQPGRSDSTALPLKKEGHRLKITVPVLPPYSVIELGG
jgi:Beta-galactosidase